jgi:dihydrofolate reductase
MPKKPPLDDYWSNAMSRLKLQMQITADGFDSTGPNDDLAWDEIRNYSRDLFDSADTIVIGRKTATDFIPYWDSAATQPGGSWYEVAKRIAAARKVVFSRTLNKPEWNNTSIESGDVVEAIERLKATNKNDIIVYGGVSFVATLVENKLIDEFHLFVNPIAAGRGKSIFSGLADSQQFKLIGATPYNSGLVLLNYELK